MEETRKVKPEVIRAFNQRCTRLRTLQNEHALTIDFSALCGFYIDCIGIPPAIQTWEEIRECLVTAVENAKLSKPQNLDFNIRLTGPCPPWLAIKVYAAVVLYCDNIFWAGDVVIQL
jgi:hypothetical protein